ncbi:RNA-binding S4 domain-containing protein [Tabrizicola thermarum]|uniref:RNA-binding S4 domain-containing protein n=1 Tax=Tabrizicola thermarum TaxID=2670345 RepID=UPI000FFC9CF9|nr:RNA-binding S4 domain-containing protein [Tabrizicola thermarum]
MAGPSGKPDPAAALRLRLDKWLWQARFFKSRTIAAEVIAAGHVRVNGTRVSRPGRDVGEGDTLTFPQGARIRVVRILALGQRRGPATEARALYLDLDPGTSSPDPLE